MGKGRFHRARNSEAISQSQGHTIGILTKKGHDHHSQDTGILKRGICRACRCALNTNNNQEVKVLEGHFIEPEIQKL